MFPKEFSTQTFVESKQTSKVPYNTLIDLLDHHVPGLDHSSSPIHRPGPGPAMEAEYFLAFSADHLYLSAFRRYSPFGQPNLETPGDATDDT